jgi:hypothetical protein
VDDICLVPFMFSPEQGEGGSSLQAFDAGGESLFDDIEERCHFASGFGELDGMAKHADSLSAALQALADTVKTKGVGPLM